jgi:hypothetical protein
MKKLEIKRIRIKLKKNILQIIIDEINSKEIKLVLKGQGKN